MKLIAGVTIRGFRSIQDCSLASIEDFTALAGLNNSGKSNFLRALNAFFNAETDPGQAVDVGEDYFRPDRKKKKAKEISVTVSFALPDQFKFRKGLEAVETLLGGRRFSITKAWRTQQLSPAYMLDGSVLDSDDRGRVDQFLQLISFRYIPNRVLPIEVIRSNHEALRDVLIRRLGRRTKGSDAAFEQIRATSDSLVAELAAHVSEASPDIEAIRLATPRSWADVVFAFGYRLGCGDGLEDVEYDDDVQGSGVQSLLMLETLHLIDRDYFQKFGWRQAAVWALEEPESSLHASLEARVGSYLADVSAQADSRLQVLCTTHSNYVLSHAKRAVVVKKELGVTRCTCPNSPTEAVEEVAQLGVSPWVHPLLFYPLDPLIIVEGKGDTIVLMEALRHVRPARVVRVASLEDLEGGSVTGGVDEIRRYVRAHARTIRARRADAPVVVILDWDAAGKASSIASAVAADAPFSVMVWPEEDANPRLDDSFRGLERFFPDRLIDQVESEGAPLMTTATSQKSIKPRDYKTVVKPALSALAAAGLRESDLVFMRPFISRVLASVGA